LLNVQKKLIHSVMNVKIVVKLVPLVLDLVLVPLVLKDYFTI